MRRVYVWMSALLGGVLLADASFITQFEYGKMLYENPRGVGCIRCHGREGQGSVIAQYKNKGAEKQLVAPPIRDLPYERFQIAIRGDKDVMPRYYLEESELEAIYLYINKLKEQSAR